ncbi:MAG TPA: hypothetical protein VMI56_17050 [Reyranella sp.]|nr:hypothetical protein [Reyranella sp.]
MIPDKVLELCSTVGTGPFSLGGIPPGSSYRTWLSQIGNENSGFYWAQDAGATKWEMGYGTVANGSPVTLSRNYIASSTGALINWQSSDGPYYVFSAPLAFLMVASILGQGYLTRPTWAPPGLRWIDFSQGLATRLIDKLFNGTKDVETGRYEGVPGMYVPSDRRPYVAKGAVSYAVTANDIGWRISVDTAAAQRTITLPAISAVDAGFVFKVTGLSGANGISIAPNGTDVIDYQTPGGTPLVVPGRVWVTVWSDGTQWRTDYVAPVVTVAPTWAGRRQTVAGGPVDANGLPTLLPNTSGSLSIASQNVSSTAPLIATAANGFNGTNGMPADTVGYSTGNLNWPGLTNNTTNYLYVLIGSNGAMTTGSTTLAPTTQRGGAPSTTNGQITFNHGEMKGYLGNGTTAPQTNVVVIGEAVTSGGSVTSTVCYAYNGQYDGPWTNTIPTNGATVSATHNIGVTPGYVDFVIECITAEFGFNIGDQLLLNKGVANSRSTLFVPAGLWANKKTASFIAGDITTALQAMGPSSSGGTNVLTYANWKYKFVADRFVF